MRDKRFKVIISEPDAELMIITPLRKKDRIIRECEASIRNQKDVRKIWVSFQSKNSASFNRIEGYKKIKAYLQKNLSPFLLFCDNDIEWKPGAFRGMIDVLEGTDDTVGYSYCGFRYSGHMNIKFPARPFDPTLLVMRNYISTMSIQKTGVFKKHGKLDMNLRRYQDWDMWLNYLLNHQIVGISCGFEGFTAHSSHSDISMMPDKNYRHLKKIISKYRLPIQLESTKEGS